MTQVSEILLKDSRVISDGMFKYVVKTLEYAESMNIQI